MLSEKKLDELAKEQMKKIYGIYHPLHHEDAVSHYKSGYRQAEADAAELVKIVDDIDCSCSYSERISGHLLNCFMPDLQEALTKWRERGV